MKRLFIALLLAGTAMAATKPSTSTFVGEISDSQCAMNVHSRTGSHKEMLVNHSMGDTEAECVKMCVRNGGVYVLVSAKDKKVYKLSDQNTPAEYAARKVKVTGTLDKATDTIKVDSIVAE